jgi:hypothetical protein
MTEPRIFHGDISPQDLARALTAEFHHPPYQVQSFSKEGRTFVQISTHDRPSSGGNTALTVGIQKVEDGISVVIGNQSWLGVAASMGQTALLTLLNPWNLINRLDDLAQDYENLQLSERVWEIIEQTTRASGATFELSERLKRAVCPYCSTGNTVGEPRCIACGAPLGYDQPTTCKKCGFVIRKSETICPNCKNPV